MNALPFILIDISIRVVNDTSEIGVFDTVYLCITGIILSVIF